MADRVADVVSLRNVVGWKNGYNLKGSRASLLPGLLCGNSEHSYLGRKNATLLPGKLMQVHAAATPGHMSPTKRWLKGSLDEGTAGAGSTFLEGHLPKKYRVPATWQINTFDVTGLTTNEEGTSLVPDIVKPTNDGETRRLSRDSGNRIVNVNMNRPMIEHFSVHTASEAAGLGDIRYKIEEVLLEILSSANAIN
jgi:hypothetical protein